MENIREEQVTEFFVEHESELLALAIARNWGPKGFELKGWTVKLLPDGYACPEEETYAELSNALDYLRGA